jgi:hypothetical protein
MSGVELIKSLFEQASAQGTRSTVLNPLGWLIASLLASLTGTAAVHGPQWLLVVLAVIVGLLVALYAVAYVFFMLRSPDALRSERFTLSKMALEQTRGDSTAGFAERPPPALLPTKSDAMFTLEGD